MKKLTNVQELQKLLEECQSKGIRVSRALRLPEPGQKVEDRVSYVYWINHPIRNNTIQLRVMTLMGYDTTVSPQQAEVLLNGHYKVIIERAELQTQDGTRVPFTRLAEIVVEPTTVSSPTLNLP